MKASQFIKQLNGLVKKHGDLELDITADGDLYEPCGGIAVAMNNDAPTEDKCTARSFTICDRETLEAFS